MKPLLIILILLLTIPTITAYSTLLNVGYTKASSYQSGGTFDLDSTAILIPGTKTLNGTIPLSADLDGDGLNELVIITYDNQLIVQNFTGTAFHNLATAQLGNTSIYGVNLRQTPGLIDYDLDGKTEIITQNNSHFITYQYTYALGLVVEQSVAIPRGNTSGSQATIAISYDIMKCSVTGNYGGIKACYTQNINKEVAEVTYDTMLYEYDLTNNSVMNITAWDDYYISHAHPQYRNLFIKDMDGNGIQDVTYALYDSSNGALRIHVAKQTGTSTLTDTLIYTYTESAGYWMSDITTGDFDGVPSNGNEIGFFYKDSATAYDAKIIDDEGNVVVAEFNDALTLVAGANCTFTNLIEVTPSSGSELFCAYTPYNNNRSLLTCFDGSTSDSDSTVGFTSGYFTKCGTFSLIDGYSDATGVLTGGYAAKFYTVSGNAADWFGFTFGDYSFDKLVPFYSTTGYDHAQAFDARSLGVDDALYSNSTDYAILNTLASNAAPTLSSYGVGTGNPSCLGVVQKYKVTLADAESDTITCVLTYSYYNDTVISSQSSTGTAFQFLVTLNETGSFKAKAWCGDTWHHNSTTHEFLQVVSNTSGCLNQDVGGQDTDVITTPVSIGTSGLTDAEIASTIGLLWTTNSKLKLLLGILIVIVIMVRVAQWTQNGAVIISAGFLGLIIAVALTLISVYVMIIALIALALILFLGKSIGSTDNGG